MTKYSMAMAPGTRTSKKKISPIGMPKADKSEVALQGFVWTKICSSQGYTLKCTKSIPIRVSIKRYVCEKSLSVFILDLSIDVKGQIWGQ